MLGSGALNTTILMNVEYCYLPKILEKGIPLRIFSVLKLRFGVWTTICPRLLKSLFK